MMRGRVEPVAVLTIVQVTKQPIKVPQMTLPQERPLREEKQEVPQMTFPQERQLREYNQEVKREHDIRFPKGEERTLMGMDMKIGWKPLQVHNIFNIYNNNTTKHKKVHRFLDYTQREWNHNLFLKCSNHQNYKYQLINHNLQRDFHLNLSWGVEWCKRWDHM